MINALILSTSVVAIILFVSIMLWPWYGNLFFARRIALVIASVFVYYLAAEIIGAIVPSSLPGSSIVLLGSESEYQTRPSLFSSLSMMASGMFFMIPIFTAVSILIPLRQS